MKKRIIASFLTICYVGLTQVCMAITNFEQLDVQMTQVPLTSRLKKDFSGYEFVITNNFKEPINIVSAQIKTDKMVIWLTKNQKLRELWE